MDSEATVRENQRETEVISEVDPEDIINQEEKVCNLEKRNAYPGRDTLSMSQNFLSTINNATPFQQSF